ncbi:23S rRNA (guanosine(2251)-2'-O)-methyltransferase RlmB [Moraxella pluranimalium]|uniref:23S rRNA (Guanosine(2251)-2'-O)-methyltransferase RlmB n=1 Tax=Moraxella pluranimalium TaxID=470453 RepID=A0A1T0CEZ8_9GAMM|nr:23S rRNA (guanosine(2251)-2'-O)-methyltransferase RlmB [Moraxella pluranimalium]OOS20937.1 23S rRNA (guanosine(2251)-2'-O)-methyltransferase RlmB [Moraxella pluranimalium]
MSSHKPAKSSFKDKAKPSNAKKSHHKAFGKSEHTGSKSFKDKKDAKPKNPYFYGIHAVTMLLKRRPEDVLNVFIQSRDDGQISDEHTKMMQMAQEFGISVQMAHKERLAELADSHQHQGVVAQARVTPVADEGLLDQLMAKDDALFLVLDQITDAHNLGACLRSACAMGVDAVIIPRHQSAPITPTVAKVSVGASEVIDVIAVTNLARTLDKLKKAGVFVFGTALDDTAKPLHECDFGGKVAIIMGSEGDGMRRLTQELCDTLVYIPMANTPDRPQSLNVSVATGMALYEVARQRLMG